MKHDSGGRSAYLKIFIFVFAALSAASHLSAAEPFVWQAAADTSRAVVTLDVAPEHYVYLDTLTFDARNGKNILIAPAAAPAAVPYDDPDAGRVMIFPAGTHRWSFTGEPPFSISVSFNGCRKASAAGPAICFAPATVHLLPAETPAAELAAAEAGDAADAVIAATAGRQSRLALGYQEPAEFLAFLEGGKAVSDPGSDPENTYSFWGILLFALLGGFALNLTPCVLPMIPINLAIIGASGSGRRTGFIRGAAYGGGMALAYGALGLAVILAGARFGELNSSPLFNTAVGAVFLVLAAAMAGFFNFGLDRASGIIHPERWPLGRTLIAAVMGVLAALLAGACVAPAVIAVLVLAAARYAAGESAALLLPFVLGLGMALPWPLAGAGLSLLPKPGRFMVKIKYLLALIIALAGIWYLTTAWQLFTVEKTPAAEVHKLAAALEESQKSGRILLIDFWASWCKNCTAMEEKTLRDPAVKAKLKDFIFCRFQAEDPADPMVSKILSHWQISGLPAFVTVAPAK